MSIDIEILSGAASWPAAEPLLNAVWPPELIAARPWRYVPLAQADFRVLVETVDDGVVCHVGIYRRQATLDGRVVHIGGIGAVATRPDQRHRGLATIALNAALRTLQDEGSTAFALLFCRPPICDFYLARGWHAFDGEILAEQGDGHGPFAALTPLVFDLVQRPRKGRLDLCGLPW
jgi:GNAT superfamily N-acetyltransferase